MADVLTPQLLIADRYEVRGELGRGGMACVYDVLDRVTGRVLALKELQPSGTSDDRANMTTLFEREYHTLTQLRHPRVIAVYDYGVSSRGPYYTMELLDGGDLRERAPLPWRTACTLVFEVCSSLALLHSRRLLHRDISPRNVRCTRDGKAKLIDFGAMTAMTSGGATIVGTPPYTAPETIQRVAVDARADLFSLGATLYTALTGRIAYPSRSFAEAVAAWNVKPAPPSVFAPDIPSRLDDLVLAMISIEPALRPASAAEVMQLLAAIADLPRDESEHVTAAYLTTPTLIGRKLTLDAVRAHLEARSRSRRAAVLLRSAPGLGRSRLLDACVLEAQTRGLHVLRATANSQSDPFAVARALTEHVMASLPIEVALPPDLYQIAASNPERAQESFLQLFRTAFSDKPLMIAVDDVHRIDPASAALLATLVDTSQAGRLFSVFTAESSGDTPSFALEVLSRRCEIVQLEPLSFYQTQQLLSSMFGDVANLDNVAREIHDVALGNPRLTIDVAQHLVDRKSIQYHAGSWTLPAQLKAEDMPRNAEDALRQKLSAVSPLARWIGEALALTYFELLTGAEFRALRPDLDPRAVDHAVSELVARGVITPVSNGYVLSNRLWIAVLRAGLDPEAARVRHRAIANVYSSKTALARIYHLFEAGADEEGLSSFAARHAEYAKSFDPSIILDNHLAKLAPTYEHAIRAAIALGRTPRQINDLRRWAVGLSLVADGEPFARVAPDWFAQLRHDSGLDLWEADTSGKTPGDRITAALTRAFERHGATPEAERVYPVDEAIRLIAEYVLYSIVIGGRMLDLDLIATLPRVMEPFAPLSPILDAIWQNALGTAEAQCEGRLDAAHARWVAVLAKLDGFMSADLSDIESVRNAIAYAIALVEAQLGLTSAVRHVKRLDKDPYQKLSALHLQKIVRLEQGDWVGADRYRREAEVLSLHLHSIQMFKQLVLIELGAYCKARDLAGIRQCTEQLRSLAAKFPAWQVHVLDAEAQFDLARGDFAAAKRGFEVSLASTAFGPDERCRSIIAWIYSRIGLTEALLALGQPEAARAWAREAIEICERRQVASLAYDLECVLAVAEASVGEVDAAISRLERVIRTQTEAGVTGVNLGLSYEARARVAIASRDQAGFESAARSAAREYRRGANSPLGARYERLVNEARRAGLRATNDLAEIAASEGFGTAMTGYVDLTANVSRLMTGAYTAQARAQRGLQLLCDMRGSAGGHLFSATDDPPQLLASFGAVPRPEHLPEFVHQHVLVERAAANTHTEVATRASLPESDAPLTASATDAGTHYDLLMLHCHELGDSGVVAVAAVTRAQKRVSAMTQTLLLQTLASHIVQAADFVTEAER